MTVCNTYYLAGPMTGYPKFNFPAFLDAAADLRDRGYVVLSPAELDIPEVMASSMASHDGKLVDGKAPSGHTFGDYLARDVKTIADMCDGVICLPWWEQSKGARLEVYVALISGKPIFDYVKGKEPRELEFDYCSHICTARKEYNESYIKLAKRLSA